jgi:Ca-activated chloride channel family protein
MSLRVQLALGLLLAAGGCKQSDPARPAVPSTGAGSPAGAVQVQLVYGSEKKTWLEEQVRLFQATTPTTAAGKRIVVVARAMGSGEAAQAIASGELQPTVFSPASGAYVTVLNSAWLAKPGRTRAIASPGAPLVLSPIVIALWKPMAEALGWPGKRLGWADLLKVNADPSGWATHGFPEWGKFKFGHTHPQYSNSGLLAVLATAYAGAGKTRGLTAADVEAPKTQAFIGSVEDTIVHYGKSTGFFADKMLEHGPTYLSAAVLYENLIIESYAKAPAVPLVAIYPVEGSFWSDHPYALLDADWVTPEQREGAEAFLTFLKARPAQERALALGFRPSDPGIPLAAPIDAAHGVDPRQPQTLLEVPEAPVLEKLLEVWARNKKGADVVLVFDKSGSMNGKPLAEAKQGANAFLSVLHDNDDVTVVVFDNHVYPPMGPLRLGTGRATVAQRLAMVSAGGGTALYDATARAYELAVARARKDPRRIHALVVMTDGRDENSELTLEQLKPRLQVEGSPVKVFTIAYGDGADQAILESIAATAQGAAARGSSATIVQVFQDVASFF